MENKVFTRCFYEGREARTQGASMLANPYKLASDEYECWQDGWVRMEAHIAGKAEALASIGWFG
jgi:hypothetical protein